MPNSYPWQVGVGSGTTKYCGGTIVAPQFVITAAHCGVLVFIGTYSGDECVAGVHDYYNTNDPNRQE